MDDGIGGDDVSQIIKKKGILFRLLSALFFIIRLIINPKIKELTFIDIFRECNIIISCFFELKYPKTPKLSINLIYYDTSLYIINKNNVSLHFYIKTHHSLYLADRICLQKRGHFNN